MHSIASRFPRSGKVCFGVRLCCCCPLALALCNDTPRPPLIIHAIYSIERGTVSAGGPAIIAQVQGFWVNGLMDIVGQPHLINLLQVLCSFQFRGCFASVPAYWATFHEWSHGLCL